MYLYNCLFMDINGPIIVIEDYPDDSLLLQEALDELNIENELKFLVPHHKYCFI